MDYIVPVPFALTSSNVPEPDTGETAWSAITAAGTGYALGDLRYLASTHTIYKCKIAGVDASATSPHVYAALPDSDATKRWKAMRPTNRHGMFDQSIGSITSRASPIEVVLTPSEFVDSLYLEGVSAAVVRAEVYDGATQVYDRTVDMAEGDVVIDAWEYCFAPIRRGTQVLLDDLPPVTGGTVKLTITDSAPVSVGTCVLGRQFVLGDTKWNAKISIANYATKNYDAETGLTTVEPGAFSKRIAAQISCPTGSVDRVVDELTRLRDTPVVWRGVKTLLNTSLNAYGYARDWEMDVAYRSRSYLSTTIESLT